MTTSAPATQPTVPPTAAPSAGTTAPLKFLNKPVTPTPAPPVLPTSSLAPTATAGSSATTPAPKFTFGGASQAPGDVKKDIFGFSSANSGTSNGSPAGFFGFGNIPTPSTATSIFSFGPTPSPTADGTKNTFSFSNTIAPAAQTAAPTTLPKFSFDTSNLLNKCYGL
ncbi:hypothetical protein F5887DRAFT_1076765 [Amanita rubescens]|nr:hypothetical protein F5887DRAFT_1076765 [Amanita rubescens]